MKNKKKGLEKNLSDYGDKDFSNFIRRSFAKSMGYSNKSLDKPIVGICYTESGYNNCHRNFPEMLEAVKRGVHASGALPIVFPVISLGETFLNPTSMMYRNLMSMCVEEMILAQPMDSVILMGGCDKTVPALLMGAFSANIPSCLLVSGPMMTGRHKGERLGACTDCRRFWAKYRSNEIDKNEINLIEDKLATTSGTCAIMGTASTMAIIADVLGIMVPNTSSIPAVHSDRLRASEDTGILAANLGLNKGILPEKIVTKKSIENALRVLLAISGSTNAIIHLTAIARRIGINISLEEFNRISEETPVIVNLKPVGEGYMEDFNASGGLNSVLLELKNKLHLDTIDITGQTLKQRLKKINNSYIDRKIIFSKSKPVNKKGGLIALFGSLAPEGAILKRAAASKKLFEHKGRAVVFSSLNDLAKRIDDPNLDVKKDDILVLQNAGPSSNSGMPEAGYLPIPKKLAKKGIKDMIRISDARMSGSAFGTIILHVTPESNKLGPLAVVQNGDYIKLSVKNNSLNLLISEKEMKNRISKISKNKKVVYERGYKSLYQKNVLPATLGCDFNFLQNKKIK
jgi:dihydroxy-acid dehydratase